MKRCIMGYMKFPPLCHTVHPPSLFCIDHQLSLSSIYSLSSNSLMRSVSLGGVRDGNPGLADDDDDDELYSRVDVFS